MKSPSLAKGWTRSGRGSGRHVPAGQWMPAYAGMTVLFMLYSVSPSQTKFSSTGPHKIVRFCGWFPEGHHCPAGALMKKCAGRRTLIALCYLLFELFICTRRPLLCAGHCRQTYIRPAFPMLLCWAGVPGWRLPGRAQPESRYGIAGSLVGRPIQF